MNQYLLAVHGDFEGGDQPSPDEMAALYAAVDTFNNEIKDEGHWVFAGGLVGPSGDAKVVDAVNGDPVVTDGPYAETKEQLGGFWVIQAPDQDTALAIASRASAACAGPIEVRTFEAEA